MSGVEGLRLLLLAVGLLAAAYVVFRLWVFGLARFLAIERPYDEVYELPTGDGYRIGLFRYRRPDSGVCSGRLPVILCHGVAANRFNLDLSDECSLARDVQRAGFDVWLVELRSGRRSSWRERPWSFDDLWRHDMDRAVAEVLERTGAPQLYWVGYSMGGMIAYAYLADPQRAGRIAGFVGIGSPATLRHGLRFRWILSLAWLVEWMPGLSLERPAKALALGAALIPGVAWRLVYHPDNAWALLRRHTLGNLVADIPRPLLRQFRRWVTGGGRIVAGEHGDLLAGLALVTTPTLLIAGADDAIAPPESVRAAHEALAAKDAELRIVGVRGGFENDYGHADLVTGRHAPLEVFPLVTDWLHAHEERRHHG